MPSLRHIVDGKTIRAYGTSEGVTKAWDTRGRGRAAETNESKMLPSGRYEKSYKVQSTNINPMMEQLLKLGFQPGDIRGDVQDFRDPNTPMMYEPYARIEYSHPQGYKAYMEARMPMNRSLPTMGPIGKGTGEYAGGFHPNDVTLSMEGPEEWHKAMEEAQKKQVNYLDAYGTSEGVEKAWDTRGRGRKAPEDVGTAKHGMGWMLDSSTIHGLSNSQKAAYSEKIKHAYSTLAKVTTSAESALVGEHEAQSLAAKWAHLWKGIAEWYHAGVMWKEIATGLKDTAVAAYVVMQIAAHSPSTAHILHVAKMAMLYAAPTVHNLSILFVPPASHLLHSSAMPERRPLKDIARNRTLRE